MSVSFFHVSPLVRQGVVGRLAQRWSSLVKCQAICLHSHSGAGTGCARIQRESKRSQKTHRCCASLVQPGQQSNIGSAVYSNPELYDRAFSLRDFTEEVDFLETIFSSCVKSGPGSFLELGCGPARHAALLQLKTHAKAIALDNVPQMLEYARAVAAEAGAPVHFMCEDMRSFSLQVCQPCLQMHLAGCFIPINQETPSLMVVMPA